MVEKLIEIYEIIYYICKMKYPRTYHFTNSPGLQNDDRHQKNVDNLIGVPIVITEKIDGENCLEESTLVCTKNDGDKTIKWICENKYKGKILTYNTYTQQEEYCEVEEHLISSESDDWYSLELYDGKSIILTGDHMVWVNDLECYRKVRNLQEGDEFLLKR